MARNPYQILGVKSDASESEIRSAYRKLAKEFHPDRNPGNRKAEERFKELGSAFAIIGDKEKRGQFDRDEIDADGNPRARIFQGAGGHAGAGAGAGGGARAGAGYEDINDVFADIFGQGRRRHSAPQAGRDLRYRITIGFVEAATGGSRRVSMPDGRSLDVTIPEGLRSGQTLRLRGEGEEGARGGPYGDLYVEVTVADHPWFRLEADTIHLDVPVTLKEVVLGETITIPTVYGNVSIRIPKGASSGASLRVKGKGMFNSKTGKHGDQIVKLRIVLPTQPDPELENFVQKWAGGQAQHPRRKFGQ